MDVNTQKGIEMSMAQFARYYESPDRKELYNVISLEFSHTRLADLVQQPKVVRQIDWVNNVWPRHLIDTQRDSTNVLAEMKYPKVQKYCLMSVKGCYTDFHVDFGGTSVWYHILRGSKVFWLIPPTEENLDTYETWVLSGKQGDIFLGDRVMECGRIRLEAGDTFMIPTGWIHAVYTPEDSLVFGGNILHTFNVRKQLGVWQLEDRTRVPNKFRYPFYFEIHWFALARYVEVLLGRQHVRNTGKSQSNETIIEHANNGHSLLKQENGIDQEVKVDEEEEDDVDIGPHHRNVKVEDEDEMSDAILKSLAMGQTMDMDESDDKDLSFGESKETFEKKPEPAGGGGGDFASTSSMGGVKKPIHLSWAEMEGLINLVEFLESLPRSKRSVPELIDNPDKLLEDAREMLELHQEDDPAVGVTGVPIVKWPDPPPKPPVILRPAPSKKRVKKQKKNKALTMNRKRRTRCKQCANCTRADCGECNFCIDMKKYGGPGKMKQSCIMRQCLTPILPGKSSCSVCKLEDTDSEGNTTLFECHVCHDITHPACLKEQGFQAEGIMNEDLTNSWECPKCMEVDDEDDEEEDEEEEDDDGDESDSSSEKAVSSRGRKRKAESDVRTHEAGTIGKRGSHAGKGPTMASTSTYQGTLRTRLRQRKGNNQKLAKQKVRQAKYHMQSSLKKGRAMLKRHPLQQKKRRLGRPPKLQAQVEPKPIIMEKIPACAAPKFVVRPAPANPPPAFVLMADDTKHPIHRDDWMMIFQFLDKRALNECMAVCKTWNRWCIHPSLWKRISYKTPISKLALCGIVRRQPLSLNLSWTNISAKQLSWLLPRLPNLKDLGLGGSTWPVVYSLASVVCPFFTSLDLQWVSGLNDSSLLSLLSSPMDHRPGYFDERSRLSNLERLCLLGADITDATMSSIVQFAPLLAHLDISFCGNLTDASIRILLDEKSPVRMTLKELNIAGCRKMTLSVFSQLESCPTLTKLIIHSCPNLAQEACLKFTEQKGVEMVTSKPSRVCRPRRP
eukprot:XP_011671726.1 PREDICTED: lysine-specific demethylase 2B isoform X2 [Strongylocentrotus purpuratus]